MAAGCHSAKILMVSFDFDEVDRLMAAGQWEELGALIAAEAKKLEAAGADFLLIGSNTIHKVCGAVEAVVGIPLLHIVDVTAETIREKGFDKVGLLGTVFTMEHDFYRERLLKNHGIETEIPCRGDRLFVNDVIDRELSFGILKEESRQRFLEIIGLLAGQAARESSWAAPRSRSWSSRNTRPFPSSTRPASTPRPRCEKPCSKT